MKRLVTAILFLTVSVAICIGGYISVIDTCKKIETSLLEVSESAKNNDYENAIKYAEEIEKIWIDIHGRIEAFVPHEETDELEEIIKSLPTYAHQGNMERLEERAEMAIDRLAHIIKNEQPLISNIF